MPLLENCVSCKATLRPPKPEHLAMCATCQELAAFGSITNLCRWCLEPLSKWEVNKHDWCNRNS